MDISLLQLLVILAINALTCYVVADIIRSF